MNLPNKLTMLRVCLIPVFLVFYLANPLGNPLSRYVALAVFVLASLTDYCDGYLARKLNLVTNFGKLMDPLADKLLTCSALIAMTELGVLPAWAVILIISREFLITGLRQLATLQGVVIAASVTAKAKTVSQMALIILALLGIPQHFLFVVLILCVALTVASAFEYLYKNKSVLR